MVFRRISHILTYGKERVLQCIRRYFINIRNEIKSYIVREGMPMTEIVEELANEYGWSECVPNFFGKLQRGSLRYIEAVQLADALDYDLAWVKRKKGGR